MTGVRFIAGIAVGWIFTAAAGGGAEADFATARGWSFLTWGMTLAQAKAAFAAAGVKAGEKLMSKDGTRILKFARDGWEGSVYFDVGGRMGQILFQSPYLNNEEKAAAITAAFVAHYGPAHETRTISYGDGERTDNFYIWRNETTVLTVTVAHYARAGTWLVWENYVPAAPPGADEGPVIPGEWINRPPDFGE